MICDECETVAHCLKNGCVPKQPRSKDEALKLALYALEKISRTHYHIETPPIESLEEKMRRIADKAITAIKQALLTATPLAAPAQQSRSDVEPVARVHTFIGPEWAVVQVLGEFNLEDELYTTPPNVATPLATQRQWVGLTDEEIYDCDEANACRSALAYAIEAKLREKNT
jgi:hypothetical protein